jgi:hypothetical protein
VVVPSLADCCLADCCCGCCILLVVSMDDDDECGFRRLANSRGASFRVVFACSCRPKFRTVGTDLVVSPSITLNVCIEIIYVLYLPQGT